MTHRTVMAARVGPASLRGEPRSVYVCAPREQTPNSNHQERIDAVLRKLIGFGDRLLYPSQPGDSAYADPVVAFAEQHGLFADPMANEATPPDLVLIIVDPLVDNPLHAPARLLATYQRADLIVTELPTILG